MSSTKPIPWYLAPLPEWLETIAIKNGWWIVWINLAGTGFGFWYYIPQFTIEPLAMWPVVPDSPTATLFFAISLALFLLGRSNEYINMLAYFGCLKLGLWTPYVLAVFAESFLASVRAPPQVVPIFGPELATIAMYGFLFCSHLAMTTQAFLIHRYSNFPPRAIAIAVIWYGGNDVVDYFVPILGTPHHTLLPVEPVVGGVVQHISPGHEIAAAGAVSLTLLASLGAILTHRVTLAS